MIRIKFVTLKPGIFAAYETHLVIKENGMYRYASFRHIAGQLYERIA